MRSACEALGIAARTMRKLLTSEDFLRIQAELDEHPRDGDDLVSFLRERVADALFTLLAARDFNQREVASELDTSRTTLIKLMGDLGLPRATELDANQIERALAQSGRDVEAAARLLRVSAHGLKKRITELQQR